MRFAHAEYISAFWLVILLILFLFWSSKARQARLRSFASSELLPELTQAVNPKKQFWKAAFLVGALALSITALLQPQWGFQWHEVKRRGLDILIAIDVSKSMLAADVKPNRLERSKLAVKDLIRKLKGDRLGLIAFAGTAYLQCPLTVDYDGFLLALNDLNITTIPRGGTSLASAIRSAIKSFEGPAKKYKALVIITDGEDHEGDPLGLAEEAKAQGIKIFCIGIGTSEGDLIQVEDQAGKKAFLKDNSGNVVKSRLNEEILQKIAIATDATFVRASGAEFGLDLIYEEKLSKMEKRDIKAEMSKYYFERFQIPLGLALVLLVLEPCINDRRKI